jgi:hypothetical protein
VGSCVRGDRDAATVTHSYSRFWLLQGQRRPVLRCPDDPKAAVVVEKAGARGKVVFYFVQWNIVTGDPYLSLVSFVNVYFIYYLKDIVIILWLIEQLES